MEAFLAAQTVSKKTILNYHIGLSALWTWAVNEGLTDQHILHQVERAKPEKRSISPYSEEDIKAMLASLSHSRCYSVPRKGETANSLPNAERNRAIILVLLDTGVRGGGAVRAEDPPGGHAQPAPDRAREGQQGAHGPVLRAHWPGAVAIPGHAQRRIGRRSAVFHVQRWIAGPERSEEAADPDRDARRGAGCDRPPVPAHVRDQLSAQRWGPYTACR